LFETAFVHLLVAGREEVKEADGRLEALTGVESQVLRLRSAKSRTLDPWKADHHLSSVFS